MQNPLVPAPTHSRTSVFQRQAGHLAAKGKFSPHRAVFCGTQHVLPPEASAALASVQEARGCIPFSDYPWRTGLLECVWASFFHGVETVGVFTHLAGFAVKSQPDRQ